MNSENWSGRNAVVTGAASGIGLALSRALIKRGVNVHMADVNDKGLSNAALELGALAHPQHLDVRDSEAVRSFIENVFRDDGRLDYLFNNAGIMISGEAHEISVEHFNRIIDINIRGVVNGVTSAYPIMVRQRHGHIINTASLAGIGPAPLMVPYAMSKHAIVGLTTSLRIEARNYGVRMSAICPATIDTPLLASQMPADLPPIAWQPDLRGHLERGAGAPYPADRLAEEVLRGVERNLCLIILPARARFIARMCRFAPELVQRKSQRVVAETLRQRKGDASKSKP